MDTLWQDLRYGLRTLIKNPGFTAVGVLTLALGLGANTAIFSLTDQILLRRLPVYKPEELVVLRADGPKTGRVSSDGDSANSFSYPMYKDLRDKNNVFAGLLARYAVPLSVAGEGQTERADGELVSGNYFEVLGVGPALGRVFTQDDDKVPGAHPVVVLSHSYWVRRFGGSPDILNKSLIVNSVPMTVVGVARRGFSGVQVGQTPDIFIPMMMKAQITPGWNGLEDYKDYWLAILGRLTPGLTAAQAEAAFAPIYHSILEDKLPLIGKWPAETRQRFLDHKLELKPGAQGRQILQKDAQTPLLILFAMVGLVLLIACANVANLVMARGAARQREIAIRMALGAGRFRLVRQFVAESLLLAALGGGAGLIAASWTLSMLIATIPASVGALGLTPELDLRLLGFNFALALLTGLFFGLAPALRATGLNLEGTLREQGSSVSGSLSQVRFRKGLVVWQIGMTALLLVSAGLFARSLDNLQGLNLGLRPDHLVSFSIAPELNGYTPQQTITLFDELRQRLASLPGVASVSAARVAIFTDSNSSSNITVEGYQPRDEDDMHVWQNWVGPGYFSTMGIPLMSGREFTNSDAATSPKVAVINETMARRFFEGREAIGARFAFGAGDKVRPDIQIVGIVSDSKHATVREKQRPFLYIPYAQESKLGSATFYVKTQQEPRHLAATLRDEVRSLDSNLPVYELKTLEQQIDESLFVDRFVTTLSISFAALAGLLAMVGLYGVMAYTVTRRTREIGIRTALGATRGDVSWLILREVFVLAVIGLITGLPAAYAVGRLIQSQLFNVTPSDPLVFVAAAVLLLLATLMGGYLPMRRAAGIDPLVALRYE